MSKGGCSPWEEKRGMMSRMEEKQDSLDPCSEPHRVGEGWQGRTKCSRQRPKGQREERAFDYDDPRNY